jgi:hypothetical protein
MREVVYSVKLVAHESMSKRQLSPGRKRTGMPDRCILLGSFYSEVIPSFRRVLYLFTTNVKTQKLLVTYMRLGAMKLTKD